MCTIAECFVAGVSRCFPGQRYVDKYENAIDTLKHNRGEGSCYECVDKSVTALACTVLGSGAAIQAVGYSCPATSPFASVVAPIQCCAICSIFSNLHTTMAPDPGQPCLTQGIGLECMALQKTFCQRNS